MPDPGGVAARERAAALVEEAVGHLLHPGGLRRSPLGAGWSGDVDAYLAEPASSEYLLARGWLCTDALRRALGERPRSDHWAVTEGSRVVGAADLILRPPPPSAVAVARARRRGELRAREVLELRALVRDGWRPDPADADVLARAADAEGALGGDLLAPWRAGGPGTLPAPLPGLRARLRRLRARRRPGRFVVALSGVDGAGKSGLARALAEDLARAGLPVSQVWARPGAPSATLHRLAQAGRRLLRQRGPHGIERLARGDAAHAVAQLPSRRGLVGRLWSLSVALAYLVDVRRQHRRARGVVICDRHLPDALVTLRLLYPGVDLRLPEALLRRLVPRADLTLLLELPAEEAARRKAGSDAFSSLPAVRAQVRAYADLRERQTTPGLALLDATRPPDELIRDALRLLLERPVST